MNHEKTAETLLSAIDAFVARARPGSALERQLCDLVIPYLPDLELDAVRRIAARLCQHEHAPRALLLALCTFPARICSTILTYTPVLTDDDFLEIIDKDQNGDRALAIARRKAISTALRDSLRALGDDRIDRSLELRQVPMSDATDQGDHAPAIVSTATTSVENLAVLAADPEPGIFATAIADMLGITPASAGALAAAPTSRNLLIALRHIGLGHADAFGVFAALAPDAARRDGIEEHFHARYREITRAAAAAQVQDWQLDDLVAMLRENKVANTDTAPARAGTRKSA